MFRKHDTANLMFLSSFLSSGDAYTYIYFFQVLPTEGVSCVNVTVFMVKPQPCRTGIIISDFHSQVFHRYGN